MNGHADIKLALTALHDFGLSIVMDDFGTDYSTLSYLHTYPFNILKIDRCFINNMSTPPFRHRIDQFLNRHGPPSGINSRRQRD